MELASKAWARHTRHVLVSMMVGVVLLEMKRVEAFHLPLTTGSRSVSSTSNIAGRGRTQRRDTLLKATLAHGVFQTFPRNETASSSNFPESEFQIVDNPPFREPRERDNFHDDYCFNQALDKLAQCAGDPRQPVVRRAAACEDMWNEFSIDPEPGWTPDVVSFNTVLKAWANAGAVLVDQHSDLSTPEHLLDPNIHIFSALDCARRTQELLDKQEKIFGVNDGLSQSYNIVMDCWAKSHTTESLAQIQSLIKRADKRKLQLDRYAFSALIEAHAYSENSVESWTNIRNIYRTMQASKDPKIIPNSQSLSILLRAYCRAARTLNSHRSSININTSLQLKELVNETMVRIEEQEQRFEETHHPQDFPDTMLYTAAIDVMAKVGTRESALQAEQIFRRLKKGKHKTPGRRQSSRPTIYTYTTLIAAWSRAAARTPEAGQRVYELLRELEGDSSIRLNHRPYAAALRGFAASHFPVKEEPDKAMLALKIVKQLRKESEHNAALKPNRAVYNAAIDCCGKVLVSSKLEATLSKDGSAIQCKMSSLKIAFALLQSMKHDNVGPDSETYVKLLLCVFHLLQPGEERTAIAHSLFLRAMRDGVAGKEVLTSLKRTAGSSYWETFIQDHGLISSRGRVDWTKMPHAWYKNQR